MPPCYIRKPKPSRRDLSLHPPSVLSPSAYRSSGGVWLHSRVVRMTRHVEWREVAVKSRISEPYLKAHLIGIILKRGERNR